MVIRDVGQMAFTITKAFVNLPCPDFSPVYAGGKWRVMPHQEMTVLLLKRKCLRWIINHEYRKDQYY